MLVQRAQLNTAASCLSWSGEQALLLWHGHSIAHLLFDEWAELDLLEEWCWQHGCQLLEGPIVQCPDMESWLAFGLRWA
jgi:hypothetical protein